MAFIEPKILKGFRDFLPAQEIARRTLTGKIEESFRLFGFVPVDTPALEYTEILLGKGGGETEKQVYRFRDQGGRDIALRYDLTVPFARFVAQYRNGLVFPFKRYHIAKVWRGENSQKGRYREFTQCDFDIVGSGSAAADFEILLMMRNTLRDIGAGDVRIHINHRGLFNRFLEKIGARESSAAILRVVDKLAKIGLDECGRLLAEIAGDDGARAILDYTGAAGGDARGNAPDGFDERLARMTELSGGDSPEAERLRVLRRCMTDAGVDGAFVLDPSITRGLDYYTGIVCETFLADDPAIGSVCSGGRYDDLAGLYSKEKISGVGASIGLDRLIAALEGLGRLPEGGSRARIAIACPEDAAAGMCQALAGRFREAGAACEVLFEGEGGGEKRLVHQYVQAEKKGARWALVPGGEAGGYVLRELSTRQDTHYSRLEDIVELVKRG